MLTKNFKTPLLMFYLYELRAAVMALCLRESSRTSPAIITRCFATENINRGKNRRPSGSKTKYVLPQSDNLLYLSACRLIMFLGLKSRWFLPL